MPTIDTLAANADRLEKSFTHWNHAYLTLVAITAICVALTFIAQWLANSKAGELDTARKAVIHAKDLQLQDEFAHRDERIAQVKAEAEIQIAGVKAESDEKIATANRRSEEISAEARREAEKLRQQNLTTEAKLIKAQKELENEKIAAALMQKTGASRVIPLKITGNSTNADPLKSSAGTEVNIEAISDWEARRAASNIAGILRIAGWKVKSLVINDDLEEGVFIESYIPARSQHLSPEQEDKEDSDIRGSSIASERLEKFLTAANWQATRVPASAGALPPGSVRIKVGYKPTPYDLDPDVREMKRKFNETIKKIDDQINQRKTNERPKP